MSGWILAARHLAGKPYGTIDTLADEHYLHNRQAHQWLYDAKSRGLVEACDGRLPGTYRLTRLGADYVAGRVEAVRRKGGIQFEATWMQPLPRYAEAAA